MAVKDVLEAEANEPNKVEGEYKGVRFSMAIGPDLDLDLLEAIDRNQITVFCEMAVGSQAYQKMKSKGMKTKKDIHELRDVILAVMGTTPGE